MRRGTGRSTKLRGLWASQSYEKVLQSHSQHCLQPCCYFLCINQTEVLLFFFGVFIPSFLLNLSPASLPSSSENSRGKLRQSVPFPRIFPLLSAAHLCFTPVPLWEPFALHIFAGLFSYMNSYQTLWSDGERPSIAIPQFFAQKKNLTWSFSFKTYVWRSCPLTSRVAQKVPCHTSNSNSLLRNVHKSHFQALHWQVISERTSILIPI